MNRIINRDEDYQSCRGYLPAPYNCIALWQKHIVVRGEDENPTKDPHYGLTRPNKRCELHKVLICMVEYGEAGVQPLEFPFDWFPMLDHYAILNRTQGAWVWCEESATTRIVFHDHGNAEDGKIKSTEIFTSLVSYKLCAKCAKTCQRMVQPLERRERNASLNIYERLNVEFELI
ncbi:hypothetical protein CYMTET_27985 [Cymbomonas tetramitiformis]|uniref:Uncharacterized protein n=1 Tax=Cymbomonas tetramitiformis TaxID=36881 RepID=A0AAE0FNW0_9CHLO|nr:hypothetical protein CYMTET_27985 [Cymbomonas tetramitiformis]